MLGAGALSVTAGQGANARKGSASVIIGTNGPDHLVGTDRADRIYGRGGADIIVGLNGHDTLHGGPGRDRIRARDHQDRVDCGLGKDVAVVGRAEDGVYGCERLNQPSPRR